MIRNISAIVYIILGVTLFSCSDDEVRVDPTSGLYKIAEGNIEAANAKVELWAEQDALEAGYNKIYFAVYDLEKNDRITNAQIHLTPVMNMGTLSHTTFTEDPAEASVNEIFPAGVAFIMRSGDMGSWTMGVELQNHRNNLTGKIEFAIQVESPSTPEIKSFVTENKEKIFVTYNFPDKLKVGINDFDIVAFKMVSPNEFVPVEDLTIVLEPEMPSMDHGSPNNVDPVHARNGHYTGKVNFTMTGDWRLNLTLLRGDALLNQLYLDVTVE